MKTKSKAPAGVKMMAGMKGAKPKMPGMMAPPPPPVPPPPAPKGKPMKKAGTKKKNPLAMAKDNANSMGKKNIGKAKKVKAK